MQVEEKEEVDGLTQMIKVLMIWNIILIITIVIQNCNPR